MPVALVALPRLILDKDSAFATVRQLTGDDLIRESAHERRKRSSEDFHRTPFMAVAAQGSSEPECQSPRIREQRGRSFQDFASSISVSQGSTGTRSLNHWSTSAKDSQAQGA